MVSYYAVGGNRDIFDSCILLGPRQYKVRRNGNNDAIGLTPGEREFGTRLFYGTFKQAAG